MTGRVERARPRPTPPVALTIAGSDSAAGAGLQADLKTMAALGVHGATAVTAVTAQSTASVLAVHPVPPEMVDLQIGAVVSDLHVASAKTGMLAGAATVAVVAARAAAGDLPLLVVDPVLAASTGRPLMEADGVDAYRTLLLPHAYVATPNLPEAAALAGLDPRELSDAPAMVEAAFRIASLGPRWVVVKGGHLPAGAGRTVTDVVLDAGSGTVGTFESARVETPNTHGTGCTLSAAIAAGLALGLGTAEAIEQARAFVHAALVGAAHWELGSGHGPLDHFTADHGR